MTTSFEFIQLILSPTAQDSLQSKYLFLPETLIGYDLTQGLVTVTWRTPRCTHKAITCHFDQKNVGYSISFLQTHGIVVSIWCFQNDVQMFLSATYHPALTNIQCQCNTVMSSTHIISHRLICVTQPPFQSSQETLGRVVIQEEMRRVAHFRKSLGCIFVGMMIMTTRMIMIRSPAALLKFLSGKQLEIHSLKIASGLICQHSNPIDLVLFQPSVLTVQRAGRPVKKLLPYCSIGHSEQYIRL